jgi:hypothetical protein
MGIKELLDLRAEDRYAGEEYEQVCADNTGSTKNRRRTPFADACSSLELDLAMVRFCRLAVRRANSDLNLEADGLMDEIVHLARRLWDCGRGVIVLEWRCGLFVLSLLAAARSALWLIFLRK